MVEYLEIHRTLGNVSWTLKKDNSHATLTHFGVSVLAGGSVSVMCRGGWEDWSGSLLCVGWVRSKITDVVNELDR